MGTTNPILRRRLLIGIPAVVIAVGVIVALVAASAWSDVQRVEIDRSQNSGVASPDNPGPQAQGSGSGDDEPIATPADSQVFLLVGSDSRALLDDTSAFGDFGGSRADVVMVLFKQGPDTAILSLPRDLLVTDICRDTEEKLSLMLEGCETMNGPTLLTLTVEAVINHPIDHFALVDLAGFQDAVDALGGYEICVDLPVRDARADLELPAGCTDADGEQTLAWMRSRRTEQLTADGWQIIPGMNDLARNERQRSFMIDMMRRLGDVSSPQAMASAGQAVAPFVTVDADLSFIDAVNLALTLRGLGSLDVTELDVPVYDSTTDAGAAVLLPSTPVADIVAQYLGSLRAQANSSAAG